MSSNFLSICLKQRMIVRVGVLRLVVLFITCFPVFLSAFCARTRSVFLSRLFSFTEENGEESKSFESTTRRMTNRLRRKTENHPLKVLGICGGIGSGKSAACQLLVSQLNAMAHIGTFSLCACVRAVKRNNKNNSHSGKSDS